MLGLEHAFQAAVTECGHPTYPEGFVLPLRLPTGARGAKESQEASVHVCTRLHLNAPRRPLRCRLLHAVMKRDSAVHVSHAIQLIHTPLTHKLHAPGAHSGDELVEMLHAAMKRDSAEADKEVEDRAALRAVRKVEAKVSDCPRWE